MGEKKRRPRYNDKIRGPGESKEIREPLDEGEFKDMNDITGPGSLKSEKKPDSPSNLASEAREQIVLFTEFQKEELLTNGLPENSGKNHIPVAFIEVKLLGYSILLTEINPENLQIGFGLCDYNNKIEFTSFNLEDLKKDLIDEDPVFSTNLDFLGKYPIAVYAKVAKEVGVIVTDDKDRRLKPLFDNFSTDVWINKSSMIDDLKPL